MSTLSTLMREFRERARDDPDLGSPRRELWHEMEKRALKRERVVLAAAARLALDYLGSDHFPHQSPNGNTKRQALALLRVALGHIPRTER